MADAIKLGDLPQLAFGELLAEPTLLQVRGPRRAITVEPQTMRVLVVLMNAAGRPVPRDKLALACWSRSTVSEDAINRAVAKVRTAVHAVAGDTVEVETIRSVGYRLISDGRQLEPAAEQTVISAVDLEQRGLAAMFEGTAGGIRTAIHYLELAVLERGDDASLWGSLAMAHVLSLQFVANDAGRAARAREAASRALGIEPNEGRSLAALTSLEPTFRAWSGKRYRLDTCLSRAMPAPAPLRFQDLLFWAHAGAMGRAHLAAEALAAEAPLVPWIQSARAYAAAAIGRCKEAFDTATLAYRRWPENRLVWFTLFHIALSAGRVAAALALVGGEDAPNDIDPAERALALDLVQALVTGRRNGLIERLTNVGSSDVDQAFIEHAVLAAAHIGDADATFSLLARLYGQDVPLRRPWITFPKIGLVHPEERNTAILFLAPLAPLRGDPRFGDMLDQVGLSEFADPQAA
jgi:DNA-binding winged helix-turn-helix (wHTH) protein